MRMAQVPPVHESVPPNLSGGSDILFDERRPAL